ncbi:MAG: LD-carboxypeptidase [Rickettsiales bacterium]|nr:LD-carboxypeptidase [Rickettsiales bacterium]
MKLKNYKPKPYTPLKKGDIVEILAPAYGIKPQEVERIKEYIKSLGLIPRVPDDLLAGDLIASAPEKIRFNQLKNALFAKDSKAIWCVKGGSGSPQIIPHLEKIKNPPEQEKLFIAFSDITSIHFFLNQEWGWKTIHGPILWQIVRDRIDKESISHIENLIFGKKYKKEFSLEVVSKNLKPQTIKTKAIIGGNLKLVQCSIGTIWEIIAKDKILLFEDINEKPYQVDRILTHIQQSNLCKGAKAIIFGDFEGGEIDMDMPLIEKILERFAEQIKIPVFRIKGIGHTERNYAIHFGVPAKIEISKNSRLVVE